MSSSPDPMKLLIKSGLVQKKLSPINLQLKSWLKFRRYLEVGIFDCIQVSSTTQIAFMKTAPKEGRGQTKTAKRN